jgi:hypothetical protein
MFDVLKRFGQKPRPVCCPERLVTVRACNHGEIL